MTGEVIKCPKMLPRIRIRIGSPRLRERKCSDGQEIGQKAGLS